MKKMITLTMATALFMPQLFLHADESHHPKEGEMQSDGMPMECEHMQKMMSQMEEISKTDDPVKRDRLIQEHMQTMQTMHEKMGMHKGDEKMACANKETQTKQAKKFKNKHDHRKTK